VKVYEEVENIGVLKDKIEPKLNKLNFSRTPIRFNLPTDPTRDRTGGLSKSIKKRRSNKRKTIKRRSNKRKTIKRRSNKRKTIKHKRKSIKRRSNKRKI
jgi:hypothetical protein